MEIQRTALYKPGGTRFGQAYECVPVCDPVLRSYCSQDCAINRTG